MTQIRPWLPKTIPRPFIFFFSTVAARCFPNKTHMRLRNPAFMVSSAAIPRPAVNTTTRLIMGLTNLLAIGGGLFVLYLAIQFRASLDDAPVPILEKDKYWGSGEYRLDPTDIRGFKIQVSDQVSGPTYFK